MRKNTLAALVCGLALAGTMFVGCGSNAASTQTSAQTSATSSSQQVQETAGEWTNNATINDVLSKEDRERFMKASTQKDLAPVALIGQQVVSGMNFAYLCWDGMDWFVDVVYESLDGAVSVTSHKPLNVGDIAMKAESGEMLSGGWSAVVPTQDYQFKPAEPFLALTAVSLENKLDLKPIALLATQVVSGTNYRFLCGIPQSDGAQEGKLYVVDIYEDLNGDASLTSQQEFDLDAYVG